MIKVQLTKKEDSAELRDVCNRRISKQYDLALWGDAKTRDDVAISNGFDAQDSLFKNMVTKLTLGGKVHTEITSEITDEMNALDYDLIMAKCNELRTMKAEAPAKKKS
jgi:hypothetical protein